jgi:GT2 family glycosyltransferase
LNSAFQFSHPEVKDLISVCVVTRNARESLQNYLNSLKKSMSGKEGWEIVVVDNESTDGTKDMLEENFPQAKYIYCQPGVGFTKGINYAVAESSGEFILIATPSTEVKGDAVLILRSYLNHFPKSGLSVQKSSTMMERLNTHQKKCQLPRWLCFTRCTCSVS